jgi:hypothetical protein
MPWRGFAISAFPPSAAIVKADIQIALASSGNASNSFSAALIHETGRVLEVIARFLGISRYVVIFDNICQEKAAANSELYL